jgi:phosphate transport system permease protein
MDRAADRAITVGGVLVIAAVLGMMVFLVYEVVPLFQGGTLLSHAGYSLGSDQSSVLGLNVDDYGTIAVAVTQDGGVTAWHAKTGVALKVPAFDLQGKQVTAFARSMDNENIAFGFADGTVQFGKVGFKSEVLPADQAASELKKLNERDSTDGSTVFSSIPGRQVRKIEVQLELQEPVKVSEAGNAIAALGYRYTDFGERPKRTMVAVDSQKGVDFIIAESKLNLFTRKVKTEVTKVVLPPLPADFEVAYALATEMGDEVYLAEKNGKVLRYTTKDLDKPVLAETVNLLPRGVELTSLGFLAGDRSLVVGGSDGSVTIHFLVPKTTASGSTDGFTLTRTRVLKSQTAAIMGMSSSLRSKTFATFDAAGNIWLRHGTSEKTILRLGAEKEKDAEKTIILTPRLDGLLAVWKDGRASFWDFYVPHPETSWRTLFGKVWYEGYPEPSYTWQSTGATDAFEPKLSLIPLIFGTLKATFYSLLFAVPIALLAAVYTSEFLPLRASGKLKPVMEIMASIPSVVLGFVAALVLAPIIENWIVAVLLVFVIVPLALILGGFLWQLLPPSLSIRWQGMGKFSVMFLVLGISLFVCFQFGPFFEKLFFAGNFKAWLDHEGSAAPFMALLLVPLTAWVLGVISSRYIMPRLGAYIRRLPLPYSAVVDFGRWLVMAVIIAAISYVLALLLQAIGMDPRNSFVGTYVQRNTLVVGFAMGFAVIPLIYTLAEDALSSVPEHLRAASLGCGATPWQTAMWIILPTALSGVFSAIMVGMGRAVGETMIVVMSAGNTPLIDLNIFNGLRALSANIAVELPEAPKDGTLYRVLFMTGLVLFGMTFVINTVAELIRLRFRKRAMQL